MSGQSREWTVIVLAGQRPAGDPLADHFSAKFKAHVPVAGQSMLSRVLGVVEDTPDTGPVVVMAQDRGVMDAVPSSSRADFLTAGSNISTSLAGVVGTERAPWPVLVTTADHPLLTSETIAHFLSHSGGCDLAVGMVERATLEAAYPQNRRTWLKFRDGHWTGANLFAFNTERSRRALEFWSRAEQDRKNVPKLLLRVGPVLALRAFTRTIGLRSGLVRLGKKFGLSIKLVDLPFAEAAIDVDKASDHALAEQILQTRPERS